MPYERLESPGRDGATPTTTSSTAAAIKLREK